MLTLNVKSIVRSLYFRYLLVLAM